MALNPTKSVAILLGTSQRLKSLFGLKSVNVAAAVIPLSDKVKILGATLDANLTMAPRVKALSSSCFYHIGCPPYLSDLLQHHKPTRSLRSSSSHQLLVPHHKLTFGSRAF